MSTPTTQDAQPTRARTKWTKIMVGCMTILVLAVLAGFLASVKLKDIIKHKTSEYNLKTLYSFMEIYAQNHGAYPCVQPRNVSIGGVSNLFPLYQAAQDKAQFLRLLQPPGSELQAFSTHPTIDEFDRNHIGYCYNVIQWISEGPLEVLMCEQGVSNGVLLLDAKDPADRPVFKDGIHVLFVNGRVIWVPADRHGRLSTNVLSAARY